MAETYLVRDLAGFRVATVEGEFLGTLEDVYGTGANDVFSVRQDDREYLIPALKTVVLKIDITHPGIYNPIDCNWLGSPVAD